MLSIIAVIPIQNAIAQTTSDIHMPTLSYCNVAPNPCGVGQTVIVNFWLAVPVLDVENPTNMSVYVTTPDGVKSLLGTFTGDLAGGTSTHYTPTKEGNYTFQMIYGGQQLSKKGYTNYYNDPSTSAVQTLIVTQTARGGLPDSPLPSAYWETPVNAENVHNWAAISGNFMGYSPTVFAITGTYNASGNYNPYTKAPASAHILWTKPWCIGGAAGAQISNDEQSGSYWTTSQYNPKYSPIIMNGIEYSTWYTTQTGSSQGIMALNLYTGQTLWTINTTYALRCGMILNFQNINQYGCVGPYIFAQDAIGFSQASNWYMYDAMTGQYLAKISHVPSLKFLGQDANGNIIGYSEVQNPNNLTLTIPTVTASGVVSNTTQFFPASKGPVLEMYNLTNAFLAAGQMSMDWSVPLNSNYDWNNALVWAVSMNPILDGQLVSNLGTNMEAYTWSGDTLIFDAGLISVTETKGYLVQAGYSTKDGSLQWITNRTGGIYQPYTNLVWNTVGQAANANGIYVRINQNTLQMAGYSDTTGKQLWTNNLNVTMSNGNMPNSYDVYGLGTVACSGLNMLYVWGLGGDVWGVNMTNGNIIWSWNTVQANGPAGTESPYGTYPIWPYGGYALAGQGSGTILYLSEGHNYSPPLFHGAKMIAINATNGELVWSNADFAVETGEAVAFGILTTFNAYDGQVYAYGMGPSKTTITAPQIGVTTATPITITGRVTDISAGASQSAVAANYPNGLPCISDASMSNFMEAVYAQHPMPYNITGVQVTLSVLDGNGNYRVIGTTTSNALGDYSFTWTPDISGDYVVYATFGGTNSYYGSQASTAFFAQEAAATLTPQATQLTTAADLYFIPAIAGLFIAIVVVGLLTILMLKKKP